MKFVLMLGIDCSTNKQADLFSSKIGDLFSLRRLGEDMDSNGRQGKYIWVHCLESADPRPNVEILGNEAKSLGVKFSASVEELKMLVEYEAGEKKVHE